MKPFSVSILLLFTFVLHAVNTLPLQAQSIPFKPDDYELVSLNVLQDQCDQAIEHFDLLFLEHIRPVILNYDSDTYPLFLLQTKVLFYSAFFRWNKDGRPTDTIISENPDSPGLLDRLVVIAEKAYRLNKNDPELQFYLASSYWKLIRSAETFFRYKDRMNFFESCLGKYAADSPFYLLFAADFHMTFSQMGGADRRKGRKLVKRLTRLYPDDVATINLLARIAESGYRYADALDLTVKVLKRSPSHIESLRRFDFLNGFFEGRRIAAIEIADADGLNENVVRHFIRITAGNEFTADTIRKLRYGLERYRLLRHVRVEYERLDSDKVVVHLHLVSDVIHLINVNTGYEAIFDSDDILVAGRARDGIRPPVFYYRNQDLGRTGLLDYYAIAISGIRWQAGLDISLFETVDIRTDFSAWTLPVLFSMEDNAARWKYKTKINYLFVQPGIGLVKKISQYNIEFALMYRPRVHFMLFDSPDTSIPDAINFTRPPVVYTEHRITFDFVADFISNLEYGWVREGFMFRVRVEWLKMTPDITWGYKGFYSTPTNLAFRFGFYGEYSKFFARLFYLSVGFHYTGGINLYKQSRIEVGKSVIGTPFGYDIKIHGFDRVVYMADHLFLVNSLYGFKTSKYFHLGLYLDGCAFFERYAASYLVQLPDDIYSFNIILGFGSFFKWTPGWLFDIVLEGSFGFDVGSQRIHGPVIGLYLQKTFLLELDDMITWRDTIRKKRNNILH